MMEMVSFQLMSTNELTDNMQYVDSGWLETFTLTNQSSLHPTDNSSQIQTRNKTKHSAKSLP